MKLTKCFFSLSILILSLTLALNQPGVLKAFPKTAFLKGVGENPQPPRNRGRNRQQIAVRVKLPPNDGAPGKRRVGAAARGEGECPPFKKDIVAALIPATNIGWTISERPTFWFYLPYTSSEKVEFKLLDEEKNPVYQTTFQHNGRPGIVRISLPETVTPLEIEQRYLWRFSVICNPEDYSKNPILDGYVRRKSLPPSVASQLEAATTPREKIAIYAENGFWSDTLTGLAQLRLQEPDNQILADEWVELLQSVGLNEIVD